VGVLVAAEVTMRVGVRVGRSFATGGVFGAAVTGGGAVGKAVPDELGRYGSRPPMMPSKTTAPAMMSHVLRLSRRCGFRGGNWGIGGR
jgi:hypothetical protein